jgi:uncharacterized protein (TIGR03790 family)
VNSLSSSKSRYSAKRSYFRHFSSNLTALLHPASLFTASSQATGYAIGNHPESKFLAVRFYLLIGWVLLSWFVAPNLHAGGGPCTYLVLYDSGDPNSVAVANYYQQARGIPERGMVPYDFFPPGRTNFTTSHMSDLIVHLRNVIQDRGMAGRVNGIAVAGTVPLFEAGPGNGLSFQGRLLVGPTRTITNPANEIYRAPGSSVTSEIRDDKPYVFPGSSVTNFFWPVSFVGFTGTGGNTPDEVFALIDRSKAADGLRADGTIYWPTNSNVRSSTREVQIPEATRDWDRLGINYKVLPGTFVEGRPDILGQIVGTSDADFGILGNRFVPGAWADHLTSFGGKLNDLSSQTRCSAWIRAGAYGSSGTVSEPFAIEEKFPDFNIYSHFRRGASLAEAFWLSIKWAAEIICVGDPLMQPWAQFPQVTLNCATNLSGTVFIGASATTSSPDGLETPFELAIDGRIIRANDTAIATWTGNGFTLDTTKLSDGWHDLRVIAYNNNAVRTQGEARRAVFVNNSGQSVTLTGPATIDRMGSNSYTVALSSIGDATKVTIQANGRTFATLPIGGGTINLAGSLFGYKGRTTLYAVATLGNGQQVWSAPLDVDVVWDPQPPTNAAPGASIARVRYFSDTTSAGFDWDTTTPTATTNYAGLASAATASYRSLIFNNSSPFTPENYNSQPGFEATHYFLAPKDGLYEFLADNLRVSGLTLEVNGQPLQHGTQDSGANIKSVPIHLAAGLHTLRWRFKATASTYKFEGWYRGGPTPGNLNANNGNVLWNRLDSIVTFGPALDGNLPPQITVGPTLSANPVTGKTVTATVTATDPDNVTSALNYSWSKIDGPGKVTFATNNSSAASTTTITFSRAGTYRLRVNAEDGGATAVGEVTAVVAATPIKVALDPTIVEQRRGLTVFFSGFLQDQFNSFIPDAPLVWTATGGTITTNGLYTAPNIPGTYQVTASARGLSATASVNVVSNYPPTVPIVSLTDFQSYIRCRAANVSDDLGPENLTYTWDTIGTPPAPVTFDQNGTSTASEVKAYYTKPGTYTIRVVVTDSDGASVSRFQTITVGPEITDIRISGGNNNSSLDPNESVDVFIRLRNNSVSALSNITATLSTTTPGVTVVQANSPYPDLGLAVRSANNIVAFRLITDASFNPGTGANLTLSLNTSAGSADLVATPFSGPTYSITESTDAAIAPGKTNKLSDSFNFVTLPFAYSFYGESYTGLYVDSKGIVGFGEESLPDPDNSSDFPANGRQLIAVAWHSANTITTDTVGDGVFTSVTGEAPNRVFNIEWRARRLNNTNDVVNCELRLYENQERFDIIYGNVSNLGVEATVGVQFDQTNYTRYSYLQPALSNGLRLTFVFGSRAVTYNPNDADSGAAPDAQIKKQGVALTLAGNPGNLTKDGFIFAGWNTAADGTGTDYAAGASYTIDADLTLYAKWTASTSYTISFDSAGGSAVAPITQAFGTVVTAPADPVRTGYAFAGWNPPLPATMPANNLTVTALWATQDPYADWLDTNHPSITGAGRAPDFDFDNDGLPNGIEFVIGSNPETPTGNNTPGYPVLTISGSNLTYTFRRSSASKAYEVRVHTSTDLTNWPTSYPIATSDGTAGPVTVSGENVTVTLPMAPDAKRFLRLEAVIP